MAQISIYHLRLKGDTENLQTTFTRTTLEQWLSKYADSPEAYEIAEETIDRLANQKITVPGRLIGYQFARNKAGSRTVRRTVRNLYRLEGCVFGHITVLKRLVLVTHDWRIVLRQRIRCDSGAEWASIKLIGFTDD